MLSIRSDACGARPRLVLLLCLGLAAAPLAGCGKRQAQKPPPPPQAGFVTIAQVPVLRTTDLPGRTESVMISDVRPQVSGVIQKRLFTEGGEVKAGQQLYQIDPSSYQAAYDSAAATLAHDEAALATAQAQAVRYKPLAAAQAVSEQDYDNAVATAREAVADVALAKASLEQARINLQYTKVLSPISGIIGASAVTPGALVTADQTTALATVTQLDPIYVDLNESAAIWLRLKQELDAGQLDNSGPNAAKVTLTLEDGTAYGPPGKLQFSEVQVDESTGTVLLRAIFPNPQHLLLPGMYVHAELREGVNKDGMVVPEQAVSHDASGAATVLLIGPKNVVSQQVIETDGQIGTDWIVTGGLKPGDRVIVDGLLNAQAGKPVTPIDETAAFPPPPADTGAARPQS